jgi:hypothetical protein
MAKAELKTRKNTKSVAAFLDAIADEQKRQDAKKVLTLMEDITKQKPMMWGSSMVGFDSYHYKYDSGREGDLFMVGFSPRKQNLTIYIMPGYKNFGPIMKKLGPHSLGKSCLYIKRLSDIHLPTLKKIITMGYKDMKETYPKK